MKKSILIAAVVFLTSVHSFSQTKDFAFRNTSLPINERLNDLINRLSLEEKANLLWELAPAIDRLDIPKYYHGNEALHGVVRPGKFTVFPQAIGLAATWNTQLLFEVSSAISDEARGRWNELKHGELQTQNHSDLLTFWSPTINMARDPRWGRTAETYGEDPYLTAQLGIQFVKGLQGNHPKYLKVVSTPKHFVANNEENNRFSCNAIISERTLREYYLPGFKAAIREGKAKSIMSAYNAVNWTPCNANRWLLSDLLRDEWGFSGYVVSDCGAPGQLTLAHKFTPTPSDAAAASIKAGMDLECNGGSYIIRDHLITAYNEGKVTMAEIDNAVQNVLHTRFELGLFDPIENNPYNKISPDIVGSPKHQKLALEAARQSMVLLKNENEILPLSRKEIKSIAIIGHNADEHVFGDYSGVPINDPVSPLQGIKNFVNKKTKINYVKSHLRLHDLSMIESIFLSTPEEIQGLKATYYVSKDFTGIPKVRTDAQVNMHSRDNPPDPFFVPGQKSVRWTGFLEAPVSGTYKIGVSSDDGIRLWFDDKVLLDSWVDRGETLDTSTVELIKGKKYKIKLDYYDGGGDASCRLWWKIPGLGLSEFTAEKKAAKESDVVIAVIGTGLYNEREGHDKEHLDLPGNQIDMLKECIKVNPNIIVVLVTGSQHTIGWIKENIPGIINSWYPGEQGGNALAEVLFGEYNPAGRLPLTYYEDISKLPDMNRYEISEGRTYMYYKGAPLWEFGYGLSYTDFNYSNINVSKERLSKEEDFELNVVLKNTGNYDGDEVIQIYASYPNTQIIRSLKQLVAFDRIHLKKSETIRLSFNLNANDFSYWNENNRKWEVEKGKVKLQVGSSSEKIWSEIEVELR